MLRMLFCLIFLSVGCSAPQPESARMVAAYELPLSTASDRSEFLHLLTEEAERNGYHVDAASDAALAQMSQVSPTTISAAVWRGNDEEAIADVSDSFGRIMLVFIVGENPENVRKFREALIPQIEQRWPQTASLPIMPNGGVPLACDLIRTPSGYEVKPGAAAKYEIGALQSPGC